jgi:hypothetical protein
MLSPTPEGIDTMVVELPVEDDAVDEDVVCRVVLLEVVEDVVVLLVETEPETTVMVPFIHEW